MTYNPGGQSADLIISHGMSLIRFPQTEPGEAPTYAGHIAGLISPAEMFHAVSTVRRASWPAYNQPCQVWRHRHLTDQQRQAIVDAVLKFEGRPYGPLKLFLHLGDWALAWARYGLTLGRVRGEVWACRRLSRLDWFPICSYLWAHAWEEALGYQFGAPAERVNPDDMHDWVKQHPEDWELVYERSV